MDKNTDQTTSQALLAEDEDSYGESYKSDYLTLYRDYVSSADAISARRTAANSFFLTVNTAYLGARGYFGEASNEGALIQMIVGILFCLVWWRMINSYKSLNGSKFRVIQMMEKRLPLASYTAEELAQKLAPKTHKGLSSIESLVPLLFALLYVIGAIYHFVVG